MAATTTLAQGSSVTLTVGATDSLLIDGARDASAIVEAVTGVPGAANRQILATHPGGQAVYGPWGDGTVKLSAVGGAIAYSQGAAPIDDEPQDVKYNQTSQSLVSGDGTTFALPVSYTLATLPAASLYPAGVAYVSDVGAGIYLRSNGTRWLPINGRALLYEVPATEPTSSTAAETTVVSVPLPIGLWSNGDSLQVTARVSKSGSSDTHTFIARISAGALTPLGTSTGWSAGQPATTNRFGMFMFNLKRVSATSVKPGTSGAGFSSASTTAPTAVTVPNMDTQQTYLQLTSTITGGGGETVTWENARVEWVPAYQ